MIEKFGSGLGQTVSLDPFDAAVYFASVDVLVNDTWDGDSLGRPGAVKTGTKVDAVYTVPELKDGTWSEFPVPAARS